CILLIGVLVFAYYQFHAPPLFFNAVEVSKVEHSAYQEEYQAIMQKHEHISEEKTIIVQQLADALHQNNTGAIHVSRQALQEKNDQDKALRKEVEGLLKKNNPDAELNDNNYIFLSFVTSTFPKG